MGKLENIPMRLGRNYPGGPGCSQLNYLLEKADSKEEQIDEILSILASEFAEEEEFQHFLR